MTGAIGVSGRVWDHSSVRVLEKESIRQFVAEASPYLTGRVLDYGCGQQPYRDIVEAAGAEYHPFDRADFPANVSGQDHGRGLGAWTEAETILCNQVLQYVPQPMPLIQRFHALLQPRRGHLVMTYPTNWDEVEPDDLWRFTKAGMTRMLEQTGFTILVHERRAEINLGGFRFPLGYGVIAQA
jgi:hypothetical protein